MGVAEDMVGAVNRSVLRRPVLLALGVCVLVALGQLTDDLGDLDGDNAQYILLARSLATGQGYRTLHEPGSPPHTFWPPVFPLMLAPVVAVAGVHYRFLHAVVAASGVIGVCWWVRYLRTISVDGRTIAWTLAVVGLSPLWSHAISRILSDIPYAMWICGALLAASRVLQRPEQWSGWWWTVACVVAAVLTRTIGWSLVAAVTCAWWDRGAGGGHRAMRIKSTLLVVVVGVVAGAWTLRNHLVAPDQMSYLTHFLAQDPLDWDQGLIGWQGIFHRIISNIWFYPLGVVDVFWCGVRWMPLWIALPMSLVCSAAVAVGAQRRWVARRSVADWYVVWHLTVLAVWPFAEIRFLVPLVPMLALYLVEGIAEIGRSIVGRWRFQARRVSVALLVVWCVTNSFGVSWRIWAAHHGGNYHEVERRYLEALQWLREHTQPGDVILAQRPPLVALMTERLSLRYPYTRDVSQIMAMIDRYGVDYVFLDGLSRMNRRFLEPVLWEQRDRFELASIIGRHGIFRVRQHVVP